MAAVDDEGLAGDEAGFGGSEEEDGVGDVGDQAEAADGDEGAGAGDEGVAEGGQGLGFDDAGQDGVDGDAVFGEFHRGGAHEAELGGFAGAIMAQARDGGDGAGDGGGEDDPASA